MQTIEAIYQDGVFKPLHELQFLENERVVLTVQKQPTKEDVLAWVKRLTEAHDRFVAERGYLPDSTLDIAEDRMRDV
jgi:predicted DNA-binding antitoxin AbrB/MazE fold protein